MGPYFSPLRAAASPGWPVFKNLLKTSEKNRLRNFKERSQRTNSLHSVQPHRRWPPLKARTQEKTLAFFAVYVAKKAVGIVQADLNDFSPNSNHARTIGEWLVLT
jgi:hypothetical protein